MPACFQMELLGNAEHYTCLNPCGFRAVNPYNNDHFTTEWFPYGIRQVKPDLDRLPVSMLYIF